MDAASNGAIVMTPDPADAGPPQDMGALSGSHPSGQACSLGASRIDPERLLLDELNRGIASLIAALDETKTSDTFWYRYWAGYLHGYEEIRRKLLTAIAMEARRGATGNTDATAEGGDSAAIAQNIGDTSHD